MCNGNFLGPETAWWGGGLPREGLVAEKFVPSLESLSSLGFEERNLGCPGNFARISGPLGVFKRLVQKKFVRFSGLLSIPKSMLGRDLVDAWCVCFFFID